MDMTSCNQSTSTKGFTLVELMIVVTIIGILAAVIAPQFLLASDKAKAGNIVALISTLKTAASRHYMDTGTFAREYTGSSYTAANHHELSVEQTYSGWSGPYLERPLNPSDNPFGGLVYVYDTIHGSAGGGFDLLGGGTDTITGLGSTLLMQMTEEQAQAVNDALEENMSGNWKSTGICEYDGTYLIVLLASQ